MVGKDGTKKVLESQPAFLGPPSKIRERAIRVQIDAERQNTQ